MNFLLLRRLVITLGLLAVVFSLAFWLYSKRASPPRAEPAAKVPPAAASTGAHPAPVVPPPTPASEKIGDFRVALDDARALRDPKLHSREFGRILRLWLERDLEAALAYLRQLPVESGDYTQGVLMVLESISLHDPDRALTLASELAKTREQLAIYSSLFAQFAQQNVQIAAQRLPRVPPGAARENAIRALTDAWVRTDPPGALAWAEGLSDTSDRAMAMEVVVTEMAGNDPLQAIDLAQKTLSGSALERTVFNALQKLTVTDPQSASGLVRLLPPGELQTLAAVDVASALAKQDIQTALAWAKTLPASGVRALVTKRAMEIWVAADAVAASRYVAALPAGQEQDETAVVIAGALAEVNPQSAVAWAQSLSSAEVRPAALSTIADTWAQRDPVAATHWVAEQPAGTLAALAPQTLNAALSYWVLQDASAVREFVRTLPPATQINAAEFVAPLLSQNNPAATLAWAESLSSPQARESALGAAYARWRDNAPTAAQAWLAAANLAPETKTRLQTLK